MWASKLWVNKNIWAKGYQHVYVFNLNMSPSKSQVSTWHVFQTCRVISFFDCYCAQVLCATQEPTGVPKVSMDWVCQHQNVWAPKQSEEPLQATGSWTSRHPGIVVSTLWKSTLCVLFLIFNLKLKSGVSIQTSKATSPRKLFSIWRVWHSSKSWSWGEGVSLACHLDCSSISNPVAEPAMLWTAVRL